MDSSSDDSCTEIWHAQVFDKINLAANTNELNLTQEIVKDDHLKAIGKLHNLRVLHLYDCVSLKGKLNFLASLTNLQELSLPFSNLNDDDLVCLSGLSNLVLLELTQNNINGIGFANLKFNKLKTLVMIMTHINIDGVKALCSSFANLESFEFSSRSKCSCMSCHTNEDDCINMDFNNDCLLELSKLEHLKKLYLSDVAVSDFGPLTNCQSLTTLSPFSLKTNISFPILPQIKKLWCPRNLSPKIVPQIHLYKSLEILDISSCLSFSSNEKLNKDDLKNSNKVLIKNLSQLQKLANLIQLDIQIDGLKSSDLMFLKDMTTLEILDLRCNENLDDGVIECFKNLSNLKSINLNATKVTEKAVDNYVRQFNNECKVFMRRVTEQKSSTLDVAYDYE